MSGVYLAEIADPSKYWKDFSDDAENPDITKTGVLPVYYKDEVRLAKPIMQSGVFHPIDKDWALRNWKKFKVALLYEVNPVGRQRDNSLFYCGFVPVGGDQLPEPQQRVKATYPKVSVFEKGPWRWLLDKALKVAEWHQITSAPGQTDQTVTWLQVDAVNAKLTFTLPYDDGAKFMSVVVDGGAGKITIAHGDGTTQVELQSSKVEVKGASEFVDTVTVGTPGAAKKTCNGEVLEQWIQSTLLPGLQGNTGAPIVLTPPVGLTFDKLKVAP